MNLPKTIRVNPICPQCGHDEFDGASPEFEAHDILTCAKCGIRTPGHILIEHGERTAAEAIEKLASDLLGKQ